MKKPYIIAEIGVNFYDTAKELGISPMDAAKMYIDEAKKAGIDCAKFQSYKAGKIASIYSPAYWDQSKEPTNSQYELFCKFDKFGKDEYQELSKYAHDIGIDFTSTPFDYDSADYLFDLIDFYKISSSDITNLPFISHIAKKNLPIYLSTGASYIGEIDDAIREIRKISDCKIALLHCVLSYPTKQKDANLKVIQTLKNIYPDFEIGYSDHVAPDDAMTTLTVAYMMGATIIEKHFTLNKKLPGNDHYHAGNPQDFALAIKNFELINNILGDGKKSVFECEKISRLQARRSLVLSCDKMAGDTIKFDDIMAKRPGTGIPPKFIEFIIGKKLKYDKKADEILSFDDII